MSLSDHLENALKGKVYVDGVYLGGPPTRINLFSKQLVQIQRASRKKSIVGRKVLEIELQLEENRDILFFGQLE